MDQTLDNKEQGLKTIVTMVYALQAAGFFLVITWLIAVIVDYVKRDDGVGT